VRIIPTYCVVLVEPKYSGNIGAIARCMKNFGVSELYMVNPCDIDDEAITRAMHARDVLESAKIYKSFEDVRRDLDYCAATSSVVDKGEKACLRKFDSIGEFAEKIKDFSGKVGIVFGREDYGLYNEEIALCDVLLTIPTSSVYPSMNLSHAVAVVLYELFKVKQNRASEIQHIGAVEKEKMNELFGEILELISYPSHKTEKAKITFRRVLARAMLSIWEYHTLMGIINEILERLRKTR